MNASISIDKGVNLQASVRRQLRRLGWAGSLLFFGIPAGLVYTSFTWGMPFLRSLGWPVFMSYDAALTVPMVLLLCAALAAYRLEGGALDWIHFKARFRLARMSWKNWLWVPGLLLILNLGYGAFSLLTRALLDHGGFFLPAFVPGFMDPRFSFTPQALIHSYHQEVVGNPWIVVGFLVVLFFNITGEELWWRGYILPRQELAFGRWAWLIHGILWTLFHSFKYWELISLLPVCLGLSFAAQRSKNTTLILIAHLIFNGMGLFGLLGAVLGGY